MAYNFEDQTYNNNLFGNSKPFSADVYDPINGASAVNSGGLSDFFGGNTFKGLSGLASLGLGGLQAYTGLQNVGMANKAFGLAKQQFGFQKSLANRNLANQAKTINNAYNNAAQVAGGMIGGTSPSGAYGFTSQDIIDRYANKAKEQHVSGSPL